MSNAESFSKAYASELKFKKHSTRFFVASSLTLEAAAAMNEAKGGESVTSISLVLAGAAVGLISLSNKNIGETVESTLLHRELEERENEQQNSDPF